MDYLKNEESLKDEEAEKRKSLVLAAHLNLAMCYLKLAEDVDACRSCDEALTLDPKSEKGLFRRGMVFSDYVVSYLVSTVYYNCFDSLWWQRDVVVNALVVINEVTLYWARLVLGWVTVCGRVNHLGM